MRGLKFLLCSATVLASVALPLAAKAQLVINLGVQPACSYGYYDYAPYSCAPRGFYGSGYFYNGIFLGVGPWSSWGYSHGWGEHRFHDSGGGRYRPTGHAPAYHSQRAAPQFNHQAQGHTQQHSQARPQPQQHQQSRPQPQPQNRGGGHDEHNSH